MNCSTNDDASENSKDQSDNVRVSLVKVTHRIKILIFRELPPEEKELRDSIDEIKPIFSENKLSSVIENLANDLSEPYKERLDAVLAVVKNLVKPSTSWTKTLFKVESKWPNWGTAWLIAGYDALSWAKQDTLNRDKLLSLAKYRLQRAHETLPVGHYGLIYALDKLRTLSRKKNRKIELVANQWLSMHRPNPTNIAHWAEVAMKLSDWVSFDLAIRYFFISHGGGSFEAELARWAEVIHGIKNNNSLDLTIKQLFASKNEVDIISRYDYLTSLGSLLILINIWAAKQCWRDHDYLSWNRMAEKIFEKSLQISTSGNKRPDRPDEYILPRLGDVLAQTLRFLPSNKMEDVKYFRERAEKIIRHMGGTYPDLAYTAQRQLAAIYTGEARRAIDMGLAESKLEEIIQRADHAYEYWYRYSYPDKRSQAARAHFDFLLSMKCFDRAFKIMHLTDIAFPAVFIEICQFGLNEKTIKELIALDFRKMESEAVLLVVSYMTQVLKGGVESKVQIKIRKVLQGTINLLASVCRSEIRRRNLKKARFYLETMKLIKEGEWKEIDWDLELCLAKEEYVSGERSLESLGYLIDSFFSTNARIKDHRLLLYILQTLLETGLKIKIPISLTWKVAADSRSTEGMASALIHQLILSEELELWSERFKFLLMNLESQGSSVLTMLSTQIANSNSSIRNQILISVFKKLDGISLNLNTSMVIWLTMVIKQMPYQELFENQLLENLTRWLESSYIASCLWPPLHNGLIDFFESLIDVLIKGILEEWNNPQECMGRAYRSIYWIMNCMPLAQRHWALVQFFGAERGITVRVAITQRQSELKKLKDDLYQKELRDEWIINLESYLKPNQQLSRIGSLFMSEEIVVMVNFCVNALDTFNPLYPDKSYWGGLEKFLNQLINTLHGTEDTPLFLTKIWLTLQECLITKSLERLREAGYSPIHSLKHKLNVYLHENILPEHLNMLNDVLDKTLAYLNWQRWPILKNRVDLKEIIENIAYQIPYIFTLDRQNQNAPRLFPIRPRTSIFVRADASMLEEVLKALLKNAREHTPSESNGGWIWLEVLVEKNSAHIIVADNGEGILQQILPDLNDQNKGFITGKKDGTGTGFGTRFCQRVARLHGGHIEITSQGPYMGTRVNIWLPLSEELV